MARVRINKEIDDFVKSFQAGADIAYKYKYLNYLENHQKANSTDALRQFLTDFRQHYQPGPIEGGPPGGGAPSGGGGKPTTYDPSKAPTFLADLNSKYGLPQDYLTKTGWIESKFDPNAHAGASSAGGMFQFTNDTAKAYGLSDKSDAQASADAAARYAADNAKLLKGALGRDATGGELYLAHQQGGAGAKALLSNPNANVLEALTPVYKGNAALARQAIVNNGGDPKMTAGQFANLWTGKYNNLSSGETKKAAVPAAEPETAPPGTHYVEYGPNKILIDDKTKAPVANLKGWSHASDVAKQLNGDAAAPDLADKPQQQPDKRADLEQPENQAVALNDDDDEANPFNPFGSMEPTAARGGMIRRYANGGAVVVPHYEEGGAVPTALDPTAAIDPARYEAPDDDEETAAVTPASAQSSSFVDDLPEAVKGGLQGLQDKFGLNQQQAGAIPQANGGFMDGVRRLFSGEGAASPQEMATMRKAVDPNGRLGEEMGNIAALTAGYRFYLQQGDVGKARQLAAAAIMYSYDSSRQLGALAAESVRRGDTGNAVKALQAAYNVVPNGKQVEVDGKTATVIDQKTGKPVQQFELTPELMFAAANKMADGSQYFQELTAIASGKMPEREVSDPAFDAYVNGIGGQGKPAAVPTGATPAPSTPPSAPGGSTSEPKVQPASIQTEVDEEGLPVAQPKQFTPSIPKPELEEMPMRPDLAGMKDKQHRISSAQDYDKRYREVKGRNDAKLKDYNEAIKSEHEAWKMNDAKEAEAFRAERSATKQRRHDEAKNVKDIYSEWEGEQKVAPPAGLSGRIRDIGQHLVEANDLHARDGIVYADQIANPGSKIKLQQNKNGSGIVTMEDGETLNLTPRAFRTVERMRKGYEEQAKEAAKPSKTREAVSLIGQGMQENTKAAGERSAAEAVRRPRPLPPDEAAIPGLVPLSPTDKFRPLGRP